MTAPKPVIIGVEPESGMSLQDAALLAVRHWVWLLAIPLVVTVIVAAIYTNLPTRVSVTSVLNSDSDVVELYARPIIDAQPESTIVTLTAGSGTVIMSVDAADADTAIGVINQIIAVVPDPEPVSTSLTPTQALELRALREYASSISELVSSGNRSETEILTLRAERGLAQQRIDYLALRDVAPTVLPKVSQEPRVTPIRQPPLRNVGIFTFTLLLFVVWGVLYGLESRRIRREKGLL